MYDGSVSHRAPLQVAYLLIESQARKARKRPWNDVGAMSRSRWQSELLDSVFYLLSKELKEKLDDKTISRLSRSPKAPIEAEIVHFFPFIGNPQVDGPYRGAIQHLHAMNKHGLYIDIEQVKRLMVWPEFFEIAAKYPTTNNDLLEYFAAAIKLQELLEGMDDKIIADKYRSLEIKFSEGLRAKRASFATRNDMFAFFQEFRAEADYSIWARMEIWSADEFVALSLGKNPQRVNAHTLMLFKPRTPSPFRDEYERRVTLIDRAVAAGSLDDPGKPKSFLAWARKAGFGLADGIEALLKEDLSSPTHKALEAAILAKDVEILRLQKALDILKNQLPYEKGKGELLPSRKTVFRLILGMAIARFEHQTEKNSRAPRYIEENLQDLTERMVRKGHLGNLSLSDDTIRTALDAAAQQLEIEWRTPLPWSGTRRKNFELD